MHPLVAAFLAQRPLREPPRDLGQLLEELVALGRAAWPRLDLAAEPFVQRQASRLTSDDGADARDHLEALRPHAADLFLASACAEGVAGAAAAFDEQHLSPLPRYLARMRADPSFVDEVRQQLRLKLLMASEDGPPRIASYAGRGPLSGWVRVAALHLAISLRRAEEAPYDSLNRSGHQVAGGRDPELELLKRRYRPEFERALQDALAELGDEDREVLRLYYVDGMTVDTLGARLGVGRSTAARRVAAARQAALEIVRRLLGERLAMASDTFASVARALRSQLERSLGGLLAR